MESMKSAGIELLNEPVCGESRLIPFELRDSLLINYRITDELMNFRVAVNCSKNKKRFKLSGSYDGIYYVYDLKVRNFKIINCIISVLDNDFPQAITSFRLDYDGYVLSWDNEFVEHLYLFFEASLLAWKPLGIVDYNDEEFNFEESNYYNMDYEFR